LRHAPAFHVPPGPAIAHRREAIIQIFHIAVPEWSAFDNAGSEPGFPHLGRTTVAIGTSLGLEPQQISGASPMWRGWAFQRARAWSPSALRSRSHGDPGVDRYPD